MKMPVELDKRRKLSDEEIDSMLGFYQTGVSIVELAKKYGVARFTVYHHVYKRFYPEKFAEMEWRKVMRLKGNRKYNLAHTHSRKERLRKVYGVKAVANHLQKIKDKWIKENPEKYLEYKRKYREKNRKKINENWMKNYYKKNTPNINNLKENK